MQIEKWDTQQADKTEGERMPTKMKNNVDVSDKQ